MDKQFITKHVVLKEAPDLFGVTTLSAYSKLFMQKLDAAVKEEWTTIIRDIQQVSKLDYYQCFI